MELIDAFEMHIFDNDKIEKQAVAHYRQVMDAMTTLTLVAQMELMDAFLVHVFAIYYTI